MKDLLKSLSEAVEKLEYSGIWKLGNKISGGHGFWGSYQLLDADNPKDMVRAWVDALRELGYSEPDIILYGDWTDGRHIADQITTGTTYDTFKKTVSRQANKDIEHVQTENEKTNRDKLRMLKQYMGLPDDSSQPGEEGFDPDSQVAPEE